MRLNSAIDTSKTPPRRAGLQNPGLSGATSNLHSTSARNRTARPIARPIAKNTFAFTAPYDTCWMAHYYGLHFKNVFDSKVIRERDFLSKIELTNRLPEIMIMGNFVAERAAIASLCRELRINVIHSEDGFFPHYLTMHADPLGFCWESSLPRLIFRKCAATQRARAQRARQEWLAFACQPLPDILKEPFVFWPLQLLGDQVNRWDLRVKDWTGLVRHFRSCLPAEYQLVLKEHPRSKACDNSGIAELAGQLPNTILIPRDTDLKTLLRQCRAVAGANSSVLYEARLMFHKPAYVYSRGWFTNHTELFLPVPFTELRPINRLDWVEDNHQLRTERLDEYTDWFLAQLLARQLSRGLAESDPRWLNQTLDRLSYSSFIKYGEEIFLDVPKRR